MARESITTPRRLGIEVTGAREKALVSGSVWGRKREYAMKHRKLLLVEDDAQDLRLTLRALKRINVVNEVDVVGDGAAALDYLFCRNAHAQRNQQTAPPWCCSTHACRNSSGLEVLEQLRQDPRTSNIPVVMPHPI